MKAKTINLTHDTCNEIVLFLDSDENGHYFVKIIAYHQEDDLGLQFQESNIKFGPSEQDILLAELFIEDFSNESAKEFVDSFSF